MENDYEVIITDDFEIESIGEIEEYVYDIEVEDTHCFFANNILVHNSVYYQIENFVNKKFGKDVDSMSTEVIDWIDNFEKTIIQKIINDTIDEFADILNVYDPTKIGVEREIIADAAVFVKKKKYFARVLDMEGVRFSSDDPYIKVMGLEVVKSSTPKWVKTKLKEAISVVLDNDERGVRKWRDQAKLEFLQQPIQDISVISGISSLNYKLTDKGIPQGSRSAIIHNEYIDANGLSSEIEPLRAGEKYKRCYLKEPNRFGTEVLSYDDDKIAEMIKNDKIFDYQTCFEKYFEIPLENMIGPIGYNMTTKPTFGDF